MGTLIEEIAIFLFLPWGTERGAPCCSVTHSQSPAVLHVGYYATQFDLLRTVRPKTAGIETREVLAPPSGATWPFGRLGTGREWKGG
jgi:hypothetical protein